MLTAGCSGEHIGGRGSYLTRDVGGPRAAAHNAAAAASARAPAAARCGPGWPAASGRDAIADSGRRGSVFADTVRIIIW